MSIWALCVCFKWSLHLAHHFTLPHELNNLLLRHRALNLFKGTRHLKLAPTGCTQHVRSHLRTALNTSLHTLMCMRTPITIPLCVGGCEITHTALHTHSSNAIAHRPRAPQHQIAPRTTVLEDQRHTRGSPPHRPDHHKNPFSFVSTFTTDSNKSIGTSIVVHPTHTHTHTHTHTIAKIQTKKPTCKHLQTCRCRFSRDGHRAHSSESSQPA